MKKIFDKFRRHRKNDEIIETNDQTLNGEQAQEEPVRHCCMCGAPEPAVNMIIRGGNNNYICDRCASMIHYQMESIYHMANEIDEENKRAADAKEVPQNNQANSKIVEVPTPHEIKEYLDQFVIGQDEAKIKLSVAVYNHYKRIYQNINDINIEKSNILLVGETGSGKTLLAKTISELLDVPFTIVDATVFTQAGYVGEDVESILSRLYQASNYDIEKTERGIVFIDEIDKTARKGDNPSITKDVSGEGVQQALLKLLEGSKVRVSPQGGRKHPEKEMVEINTKNILFICSGAFVGIERPIGNRLNTKAIGFSNDKGKKNVDKKALIQYLTAEDVRSYGMIPELVGRLPVVTHINPLTKDDLKRILTEPKNAIIKQYKKNMSIDGVQLVFAGDALDYIVDKAYDMKVGARGLRSIVEEIMTPYMYDAPSSDKKKVVITRKYAESVYEKKHKIQV